MQHDAARRVTTVNRVYLIVALFLVSLFDTAEEALDRRETMNADYYVSDYRLPGMDGLEFLKSVQQASAKPIRAVLLTGDLSNGSSNLAEASPWPVLRKPVDLPELLSALDLPQSARTQAASPASV